MFYENKNFYFAVDEAVEIAHNAIFANHGQNCCAGSRTYVHEKVYDEFVKKSVEKTKARKVGDPFQEGIQQGPQVNIFSKHLLLLVSYSLPRAYSISLSCQK